MLESELGANPHQACPAGMACATRGVPLQCPAGSSRQGHLPLSALLCWEVVGSSLAVMGTAHSQRQWACRVSLL